MTKCTMFTWSGRELDTPKLWSKDVLQIKWIKICTVKNLLLGVHAQ